MAKNSVEPRVVLDRMRYVKDKLPSTFCLFAIVFDVLYFVLIYRINMDYFYNYKIGISIVVNLLFMLLAFLCSEEVKNYHGKFGYLMIVLGFVQIARIFFFPMSASTSTHLVNNEAITVMSNVQLIKSIIYLSTSCVFMVIGGLVSIRNSKILNKSLNK